jgi:sorbitol/mannitol transport system permease protein
MLDNIFTLVILYTAMNLPIAVWMMRSFFLEVPGELLEAAEMDGAPLRRTVTEVILPVVAPGLAATALTLPVILAGWIAQRQLVRGLSFGAIK